MSALTIVMYHYVRPIRGSRYPNVKGLEFEGFRRQLDHLEANFRIVDAREVVAAARGEATLPENACLLTFDDGYRDHFDHVLPELAKRKLTGAFFPPVRAIVGRKMLDVNGIQFMLEKCGDEVAPLIADLDAAARARGVSDAELAEARRVHATPGRYDGPDVMYVKRMLQHVLPEAIREDIVVELFERHVGMDEAAFVDELYMTADDAREMVAAGMTLGSHGDRHVWFDREPRESQARELDASLGFLGSIGVPAEDWIMCYPYGGYNADTLELLAERRCGLGLTTRVGTARMGKDPALELPRMNTNDFPQ